MRRLVVLVLLLCSCEAEPPPKAWWPKEGEFKATMTDARARLIRVIRERRLYDHLELGRDECENIQPHGMGAICRKHDRSMIVIRFPARDNEGRDAFRERAYMCRETGLYWYRWSRLDGTRVKWLGPYASGMQQIPD